MIYILSLECGCPVERNLNDRESVRTVNTELGCVAALYHRTVDLNLKFRQCIRLNSALFSGEFQSLACVLNTELNLLITCRT